MTNDELILSRLSGDFRRLAEIVGVENALRVSAEFGGLWICIPQLHALSLEARNRAIRAVYDEARDKTKVVRSLARKHDLTSRQIYNILGTEPGSEPLILPLFSEETPEVK